jgi:hypothetical protein
MAWNTDDEAGGSEETPQIFVWTPQFLIELQDEVYGVSSNTRPTLDYSYARLSGTALRTGQQPNM